MKKLTFVFLFLIFSVVVFAQHKITLQLKVSNDTSNSKYFFASNLNGWNPADTNFRFQKKSANEFVLNLPSSNVELIQYKITKGSWDAVESTVSGEDISNRVIRKVEIHSDTSIAITVAQWKNSVAKIRTSTASKNVKIINEKFPLTYLGKTRRVWIYLPENYTSSKKKYPVIYMHDGQNLFDVLTAPFGEWGVDECLDTLSRKLNFDVIVVGIDNGGVDRLSEYSPYDFKVNADEVNVWDVKGTGSLYLESLVKEVKPYIDQHYRTKKDVRHTIVCGSSMGGLISLYACMRYPNVFGYAGVFSPAFWTNVGDLQKEIEARQFKWSANIYMIAGDLEGKRYTDNMYEISLLLSKLSNSKITTTTIPNEQHNEKFWRGKMPEFITWISNSF